MNKIVFGAKAALTTIFDKLFLKGTFLYVGILDKSISLVQDGVFTALSSFATALYSSGKGHIKLPTTNMAIGSLIIQFGISTVTVGTPLVVSLSTPFISNTICLLTSNASTTAGIGTRGAFSGTGNLTSITLNADGTAGSYNVSWIAIGY